MGWQTFKVCKVYFEFFDVPIFKFTADMVDFILQRTLGTFIPKVAAAFTADELIVWALKNGNVFWQTFHSFLPIT